MSYSKEDYIQWLTIRFAEALKVEPSEVQQETTFDRLGLGCTNQCHAAGISAGGVLGLRDSFTYLAIRCEHIK